MDKFLLGELGTGELGGDMQTTTIDTHLQVRRSSPKQKHQQPKQTRRLQPLHPLQRLQPLQRLHPLQLLQLQAARLRWAVRYRYAQDGILPCEAVATVMPLTLVSGWRQRTCQRSQRSQSSWRCLRLEPENPSNPFEGWVGHFFFRCLIVWYPWYPKNRSF